MIIHENCNQAEDGIVCWSILCFCNILPKIVHILISRNVLLIISEDRKFSIKDLVSLKGLLVMSWHDGKHYFKSSTRMDFKHLPQETGTVTQQLSICTTPIGEMSSSRHPSQMAHHHLPYSSRESDALRLCTHVTDTKKYTHTYEEK